MRLIRILGKRYYITVTIKQLNHWLDSCEDTLTLLKGSNRDGSTNYKKRLRKLKNRIEKVLEVKSKGEIKAMYGKRIEEIKAGGLNDGK